MSSSNKTAKLGLNQWAASDPVLREDFNADNQALEAAFAASPYETLLEMTTTAAASQVDIDLSGIDWDKYMWVRVYTVLKSTTTSSSTSYSFKLLLDNRTYDYQYHTTSSSESGGDCLCYLYAQPTRPCFHELHLGYTGSFVCFRAPGLMDGKNYDYDPRTGRIATTSAPATLNLVRGNTDYQIAAGTKIKIVGIRA